MMLLSVRGRSIESVAVLSPGTLRYIVESHISQSIHDFSFVILSQVNASQTMHY